MIRSLLMLSVIVNLFLILGFDYPVLDQDGNVKAVPMDTVVFDSMSLRHFWDLALPDQFRYDTNSHTIEYQEKIITAESLGLPQDSINFLRSFLRVYPGSECKPTLNRTRQGNNPQQLITSYVIRQEDIEAAIRVDPTNAVGVRVIQALRMSNTVRDKFLQCQRSHDCRSLSQDDINSITSHLYVVPVRIDPLDSTHFKDIPVYQVGPGQFSPSDSLNPQVAFDLTIPCPTCRYQNQ